MRRFTQIKGDKKLSEIRRLPRAGKIRGGIRVKKKKEDGRCKHPKNDICFFCTYPKETQHFIVPPEVAKIYGNEPTELDILIPVEDIGVIFPQCYEYYGSSRGLKCTGNGEEALRYNEQTKGMDSVECPCDLLIGNKCSQRAHFSFILPKVSVGEVYQLDTSSYNSIVDINSSLDYIKALVGRFSMIPLKLKREPRETFHDGMKQIHYTMKVVLEGDISFLNTLRDNTKRVLQGPQYALPAPQIENPVFDDGPTYDEDALAIKGEAIEGCIDSEIVPTTEDVIIQKLEALKTLADIEAFAKWSEENKIAIEGIPQEVKVAARKLFGVKKDAIEKASQENLKALIESEINKATTIEQLDIAFAKTEDIKDNPTKVKLKMSRDRKAQEIKK